MTSKEAQVIKSFLDSQSQIHDWNVCYHLVKDTFDILHNEFHKICGDLKNRSIIDESNNGFFYYRIGFKRT
jgi:hypothetical protein